MVSEKTRISLPSIEPLRQLSQSLAMLDAIVCPRFELRYYSFNAAWKGGEMMAALNNGSGDDYFILFNQAGAIAKGFDHESEMSPYASESGTVWQGVLDQVPQEFQSFLEEPAFTIADTTFCLWRRYTDPSWQVGQINYPGGNEDADGSGWMLPLQMDRPADYIEWAEDYHEQILNLEAVKTIYEHQPLTEELVKSLNPEISLLELEEDIKEIGYAN
jgi:hypothetical protein